MDGDKKGAIAEQPNGESRMGRYFRYLIIATGLIFFLILTVSIIMKKFGA